MEIRLTPHPNEKYITDMYINEEFVSSVLTDLLWDVFRKDIVLCKMLDARKEVTLNYEEVRGE